jgi:hypothetical protein
MTNFFLLLLIACSHTRTGDRKLEKREVPSFLVDAARVLEDPEYYEKRFANGTILYEAKSSGEMETSLSFDKKGNFLEKEQDVDFKDLPLSVRSTIVFYLGQEYQDFKIIEVEHKTTPSGSFVDVEIRHPSSPSGYWELTFSKDGKFVSREIEDYEEPQTLN